MHNVTINIFYNSLWLNYFTKYFQRYFKIITVKKYTLRYKYKCISTIDIAKNYDKIRYLLTFKINLRTWYYTKYLILAFVKNDHSIIIKIYLSVKKCILRLQCISNNK